MTSSSPEIRAKIKHHERRNTAGVGSAARFSRRRTITPMKLRVIKAENGVRKREAARFYLLLSLSLFLSLLLAFMSETSCGGGLARKAPCSQGVLASIKSILPCIGRWHYSPRQEEEISQRRSVEGKHFSFS